MRDEHLWYEDQAKEANQKEKAPVDNQLERAQAERDRLAQEEEQAKEHIRRVVVGNAVEAGLRAAGHPEEVEVIMKRISGPFPSRSGKNEVFWAIEFPKADPVYFGPFEYKPDNPPLSRYVPVRSTGLFVHGDKTYEKFSDALLAAAKAHIKKIDEQLLAARHLIKPTSKR